MLLLRERKVDCKLRRARADKLPPLLQLFSLSSPHLRNQVVSRREYLLTPKLTLALLRLALSFPVCMDLSIQIWSSRRNPSHPKTLIRNFSSLLCITGSPHARCMDWITRTGAASLPHNHKHHHRSNMPAKKRRVHKFKPHVQIEFLGDLKGSQSFRFTWREPRRERLIRSDGKAQSATLLRQATEHFVSRTSAVVWAQEKEKELIRKFAGEIISLPTSTQEQQET